VKLNSNRMARSRQRLGDIHDPGQTTQEIQRRIALDLEKLADQARQQQSQSQPQPGQGQGQKPQPGQGEQPANQGQPGQSSMKGGNTPAGQSTMRGGPGGDGGPPRDIVETARNWGALTPRQRQAVLDSASDQVLEKYRRLTDEYYRAMAEKATEHR
jgi:hypothetical protein